MKPMHRFGGFVVGTAGLLVVAACFPFPIPRGFVPADNQPPKIETGGDRLVYEETTVELDASGTTDPDGDALTFHWEQVAGAPVELSNAETARATFRAPIVAVDTVLSFQVLVVDARGACSAENVNVTVRVKAIRAGNDKIVGPRLKVNLRGYNRGIGGHVTYAWRQIVGPAVTLSGADTLETSFISPEVEEDTVLTFELTGTNQLGVTDSDTVDVTVKVGPLHVRFKTTMGEFVILLRPDRAPVTVANFLDYVNFGFYVGLTIHRVIPAETLPGGIVQGGGWDVNLNSPPRFPPIELESNNGLSNVRGSVAMARLSAPDTATSEFYVNTDDNLDLDYDNPPGSLGYAVFGEIVERMDVIDAMSHVETTSRPAPWNPGVTFYDLPVVPILIEAVTIE